MSNHLFVKNSDNTFYATSDFSESDVIQLAQEMLMHKMRVPPVLKVNRPADAISYLSLRLALLDYELFCMLTLDSQGGVINCHELSKGTVNKAVVYPRDVAKAAIDDRAVAVIFAHNHPVGKALPSDSDVTMTESLIKMLRLMDIRVNDHIIIAGNSEYSFSDNGRL